MDGRVYEWQWVSRLIGAPGARRSTVVLSPSSFSFSPSTKSSSRNCAVSLESSSFMRSKSWPANCTHAMISLALLSGMMVAEGVAVLLSSLSRQNRALERQKSRVGEHRVAINN